MSTTRRNTKAQRLRNLARDVQKLGELRDEASRLKAAERALTDQVVAAMGDLKLDAAESADYAAQLAATATWVVDAEAFKGAVPPATFLACVRVSAADARKHLTDAQLHRVAEEKTGRRLRVSRRAKGA